MEQMPVSEHKRPLLPADDTEIPRKEQMPASEQKRPTFTGNDTNMTAGY